MVFTNDEWLPSYEELKVPELGMTTAPLKAGAFHMGKYCDTECKEYMLCSKEEKDPRKCLNEGKAVTRCGVKFFQEVKNSCAEEFTKYWQCIDRASFSLEYSWCRKSQDVYDRCVADKMNLQRPPIGFFTKVRIHNTNRPKPELKMPECPEPTPELPNVDNAPVPESFKRHGMRDPGTFL